MKHIRLWVGLAALAGAGMAFAEDAYLRLRCDGEAAGAIVSVNGVKKGECPIDLVVPEGKVRVGVRKQLDEHRFKTFEKELFLAAGAMKRETVVLGPLQLTPEGQRLEAERVAREQAEAQAQAAAALAEQKRREAEKAREGSTILAMDIISSRGDFANINPILWSSSAPLMTLDLPVFTLLDLISKKKLSRTAGDPAAFANPDSMVARAQRRQAAGAIVE